MLKAILTSSLALLTLLFGAVFMWKTRSGSCTASAPPQCSYSPGLFGTGVLIISIVVAAVLCWMAWRPRG